MDVQNKYCTLKPTLPYNEQVNRALKIPSSWKMISFCFWGPDCFFNKEANCLVSGIVT